LTGIVFASIGPKCILLGLGPWIWPTPDRCPMHGQPLEAARSVPGCLQRGAVDGYSIEHAREVCIVAGCRGREGSRAFLNP
jgi:hypothetical protein